MNRGFWWRSFVSAVLILAPLPTLAGATISFSGAFSQDDNIQLFTFNLASTASVVLQTWSFAGGTNANSQLIPSGGFAPVLSLFDEAGNWLATDRNDLSGTCNPRNTDPVSNFCWDAYLNPTLSAGNYTLALTQDDNIPSGLTLSDGFTESGNGNFTGPLFLGPAGAGLSFILADGSQRTGAWAVDLVGVSSAAEVPEPVPALLALSGLAWMIGWRRKASPGNR